MSLVSFDSPSFERVEIPAASAYDHYVNAEVNIASEPSDSYSANPSDGKKMMRKNNRFSPGSSFGGSWDYSEVD